MDEQRGHTNGPHLGPHHGAHRTRAAFPAGLEQPEGSFRFSVDALLLACFAVRTLKERAGPHNPAARVLDLGCGCGAAGFAALLALSAFRSPDGSGTGASLHGVDMVPELVRAARRNAGHLGLAERSAFTCADVAAFAAPEQFELVIANPPFRDPSRGRLPRDEGRRKALFATPQTLPAFVDAAARAMAPHGIAALIFPAERAGVLERELGARGLDTVTVLHIASRRGKDPFRTLFAAVRGAAHPGAAWIRAHTGGERCATLALMEAAGPRYTREALEFCPYLVPPWPGTEGVFTHDSGTQDPGAEHAGTGE